MDDVPNLDDEFDFEWQHRDELDELNALDDGVVQQSGCRIGQQQQQRVVTLISRDCETSCCSSILASNALDVPVIPPSTTARKRSGDATVVDHGDDVSCSNLKKRLRRDYCPDATADNWVTPLRSRRSGDNHRSTTTATEFDGGTRVYLRLRSKDADQPSIGGGRIRGGHGDYNLLQSSYDSLRMQIEKERESKLMREIESSNAGSSSSSSVPTDCDAAGDGDLWVERFKPNCYLELLSNDETNRNLLRWLKRWDKLVFGREIKCRSKKSEDDGKSGSKYGGPDAKATVDLELDQWNRPNKKVALLCGPPGLGKTTLAHIIAKHAGYKPVEMNASDDRSAEAFGNQIEAATAMRSVIGRDPRPNCLIIDEIDGAPSTAVDVLLSVVAAKPTNVSGGESTTTKNKKRKARGFLQRPIICICNDQYAPALRLLRNQAFLLHFPQTLSSRLVTRLMEICHAQQLRVDSSTLLSLVEKTETDIRSCLSTLEFVHGRSKELKMADVSSMAVGQKDVQKGLFSVWQEMFRLPKPKRSFKVSQTTVADATVDGGLSLSERFRNTLSVAQGFGDYDKIHLGLHENYPTVKCKDHDLAKASYGIDWLAFVDRFGREIEHSKNYSLMTYLPFASVAFHLLFASASHTKIQFPSAHYDFVTKRMRSMNIVEALVSELEPSARIYVNGSILVSDVLPLLLDIIRPTMRQVNTQLYSATEKRQLQHLLDTMIAFSLVYRQQLDADGQYTYVLDHPIDLVAEFPGSTLRRQLSYATKQLISREVERERMIKRDAAAPNVTDQIRPAETSRPGSESIAARVPSHLQKLQPKRLKNKSEKPARDFFGRIIPPKTPIRTEGEASSDVQRGGNAKGRVWFHFKEGYSNAVRKNVLIDSLL